MAKKCTYQKKLLVWINLIEIIKTQNLVFISNPLKVTRKKYLKKLATTKNRLIRVQSFTDDGTVYSPSHLFPLQVLSSICHSLLLSKPELFVPVTCSTTKNKARSIVEVAINISSFFIYIWNKHENSLLSGPSCRPSKWELLFSEPCMNVGICIF